MNSYVQKMKCKIMIQMIGLVFLIGCASGPSSFYRSSLHYSDSRLKVAIVPFMNLTPEKDAGRKVSNVLITHVLKSGCFDVIEIGETLKAIKDAKIRSEESLSIEEIKQIGKLTAVDFLLMGAVEEYKIDSGTLLGEKVFVPEVSVIIRLVSTKDGAIIWSANHHRRGDDRVTVFGMGRIDSISKLTDVILGDTINALAKIIKQRPYLFNSYKNGENTPPPSPEAISLKEEKESLQKEVESLKKSNEEIAGEVISLKNKLQDIEKTSAAKVAQLQTVAETSEIPAVVQPSRPPAEVPSKDAQFVITEKQQQVSAIDPLSAETSTQSGVQGPVPMPKEVAVSEAMGGQSTPADPRERIKEQYKKEFEKIKKQYP